jgi:hypothetical protein
MNFPGKHHSWRLWLAAALIMLAALFLHHHKHDQ